MRFKKESNLKAIICPTAQLEYTSLNIVGKELLKGNRFDIISTKYSIEFRLIIIINIIIIIIMDYYYHYY